MPELAVFIISLAAIIFGADWLGNSAIYIAKQLSLPRILIGATIVSLATTIPEIVIAAISGVSGVPELGISTAFGSPIVNIGLIFGILLLFSKAEVDKTAYIRTIQFFLVILAFVFLFSFGGTISQFSGVVLIILGIVYLMIEFVIGRHEENFLESIETRFERLKNFFASRKNYHQIFYLIAGGLLLFGGGHFLVGSGVILADVLGVPQIIIGLLVIAFGTSLPEAFIAISSIVKNRPQVSTGNLFGASILDLTIAVGAASVFGGVNIDAGGLYLTIGTTAVLATISLFSIFGKISPKILGGLLIIIYFVFVAWFAGLEF